jgi:uncharacterized protein YcbX
MAGTGMESAVLGWHGLVGDRRFAIRRIDDTGGFPWLTASRLPGLVTYQPCDFDEASAELLPTRVRTPAGARLDIRGDELRRDLAAHFGSAVELMYLQQGIFDDSPVSIITMATMTRICDEAGVTADSRRFCPNIVIDCNGNAPFTEDEWLSGVLVFGENGSAAAVHITKQDARCMMINLDPDTAIQDAGVMKAAVRLNDNNAGVYATVIRTGTVRVGDPVLLETLPAPSRRRQ